MEFTRRYSKPETTLEDASTEQVDSIEDIGDTALGFPSPGRLP